MSSFLVVGLPRSRTAWMAVAASTLSNTFCYHEPMWFLPCYQSLRALWQCGIENNIGISDHALGFQLKRILEDVGPRTLIIDRDIDECVQSLKAFDVDAERFCFELAESIDACLPHPLVKVVDFSEVSATLPDCLKWLVPDAEINPRKIAQIRDMKIEADIEIVYRKLKAAKDHSHWYLPNSLRAARVA